jgi:glycoside hydrolase-like protein
MIEGVDYSSDHPDPSGLYTVGKRFAGRYLGPGAGLKMLTRSEADALAAAGLFIVALVEGYADDALQGYAKGKEHAEMALAAAPGLGMPEGHPFYAAVDFDVQPSQWDAVRAYFAGFASVVGINRTGMYGGYNAMVWAARDGVARWLYQTYAWSGDRWYVDRHIEQYRNDVSLVGGTVDLDRGLTPYFGQWMTGGAPVTQPTTTLTKKDIANIWAFDPGKVGGPTVGQLVQTEISTDAATKTVELMGSKLDAVLAAVQADPDRPSLDALAAKVDALTSTLQSLVDKPVIDAVAVAKAIAADPSIVGDLADAVTARLGRLQAEITLGGTLSGGIVAPPTG